MLCDIPSNREAFFNSSFSPRRSEIMSRLSGGLAGLELDMKETAVQASNQQTNGSDHNSRCSSDSEYF